MDDLERRRQEQAREAAHKQALADRAKLQRDGVPPAPPDPFSAFDPSNPNPNPQRTNDNTP